MLSGDKDRTPEQIKNDAKWMGTGFAIAVVSVLTLALFAAILIQPQGCRGSTQQSVPTAPCEEQPPIECIANTIEQASSSQFEHYVYCACVTDDGLSKGYVAAIKRPLARQTLPWIPDHDSSR